MGIVDLMATDPTPLPQQPPALPRHREQPHLDTISGAWRAFEDARDRDGDWGQDTLGKQLDLAERILRLSEEQVEVRRYAEACKNLLVVDNLTDRTLPPGSLNKRRLALRATLFHCYACVRKGQGRVPDALRYAEKALSVMMSLNRLADLPQCYLNLGSLLASMGLHAEALKHSFLALQTVKELMQQYKNGTMSEANWQSLEADSILPYPAYPPARARDESAASVNVSGITDASVVAADVPELVLPVSEEEADLLQQLQEAAQRVQGLWRQLEDSGAFDDPEELHRLLEAFPAPGAMSDSFTTASDARLPEVAVHFSQMDQAYNPGLISADSGGQQQNDVTSLVRKLRDAEAAFCVLDEQHQKLSSAQKPQPKSMASRPGYRKPTLSPAALQMPGSARSEGAETLPRLVSPGGIPPSENPDGVTVRLGTLLAISYHNIAVEQEHVGEYAKCKSTYRIAFLTAEDFLGPDHPLPIQFRSSYQQALRAHSQRLERDRHLKSRIKTISPRTKRRQWTEMQRVATSTANLTSRAFAGGSVLRASTKSPPRTGPKAVSVQALRARQPVSVEQMERRIHNRVRKEQYALDDVELLLEEAAKGGNLHATAQHRLQDLQLMRRRHQRELYELDRKSFHSDRVFEGNNTVKEQLWQRHAREQREMLDLLRTTLDSSAEGSIVLPAGPTAGPDRLRGLRSKARKSRAAEDPAPPAAPAVGTLGDAEGPEPPGGTPPPPPSPNASYLLPSLAGSTLALSQACSVVESLLNASSEHQVLPDELTDALSGLLQRPASAGPAARALRKGLRPGASDNSTGGRVMQDRRAPHPSGRHSSLL